MKNIQFLAPELPESVSTAIILKWNKKCGEKVKIDEILVEIETDKIILEVVAPVSGILIKKFFSQGDVIQSKIILGIIQKFPKSIAKNEDNFLNFSHKKIKRKKNIKKNKLISSLHLSPFQRRLQKIKLFSEENNKNDNINFKEKNENTQSFKINNKSHIPIKKINILENNKNDNIFKKSEKKNIKKISMSPIRQKIAERLLFTQKNTVMLTTFNEVNMTSIIKIRTEYFKFFKKKYNIRLGYMSFFVQAVTEALKKFPIINSSKEDNNIIYYKFYNISIAVSTSRGLLTPVLKNTQNMNMVDIEKKIKYFSKIGEKGTLKLEDLQNGTFTITNGGIFGSLLSTPIINPPQSAILGMHNILKRPIVLQDQILIQPMMYLSLTYDHQIIDGQQAIQFLKYVIEILENFSRINLNI